MFFKSPFTRGAELIMDISALYHSLNKIKMLVMLHLGSTFIVDNSLY